MPLYYAYGSNMLKERIFRSTPGAQRVGIAKLKGFRLVFEAYSNRWNGSVATIQPEANSFIWGVLWDITPEHLANLDMQEIGYFRFEVEVEEPNKCLKECFVYQMREEIIKNRNLTDSKVPSLAYLKTLINGAKESGLSEEYIEYLEQLPHNGFDGEIRYNELY